MKFINVKTKEVKDFKENELEYIPYVQTITEGILAGHQHVSAYWDKDGNEWRRQPNYIVKGSFCPFDSYQ